MKSREDGDDDEMGAFSISLLPSECYGTRTLVDFDLFRRVLWAGSLQKLSCATCAFASVRVRTDVLIVCCGFSR